MAGNKFSLCSECRKDKNFDQSGNILEMTHVLVAIQSFLHVLYEYEYVIFCKFLYSNTVLDCKSLLVVFWLILPNLIKKFSEPYHFHGPIYKYGMVVVVLLAFPGGALTLDLRARANAELDRSYLIYEYCD